jgi:hypothetical protein
LDTHRTQPKELPGQRRPELVPETYGGLQPAGPDSALALAAGDAGGPEPALGNGANGAAQGLDGAERGLDGVLRRSAALPVALCPRYHLSSRRQPWPSLR